MKPEGQAPLPPPADRDVAARNPLVGIACKVASVVLFVGMSTCIKAAGEVTPGQIVFFRSFFALFPILAVVAWRHELRTVFYTSNPIGHVLRGLVGVGSMGLSFFALTKLPLPEAITLNYAQPLLVVVFSALFIGETVRAFRWSAVAIGFIGVFIIAWPKLTLLSGSALGHEEAIGVTAALAGAGCSAVAMLLVRKLVRTESTFTIVLGFTLVSTVAGLASIPFGWDRLDTFQIAVLVSSGLLGGLAQILMTESYRHADMSTIAPFEYTSILFALVLGYLAFGDVPTVHMLVGGAIVIGSGLLIIWRERRLGLQRAAARKVAPPQ